MVFLMTWEGGWDYKQTIFNACGLGTWPHHTTYTTPYIYTALHRFGPKPGSGKKTLQNASYIWKLFQKVGLSLQRGDIDVNTSHTKVLLFFKFLDVSSIWHTFFPDFRCPKTMQNAKYIYNFSKKVALSFERGDIDVRTSHAKTLLFFTFSSISRFGHTFFTKSHDFSAVP